MINLELHRHSEFLTGRKTVLRHWTMGINLG